MPLETKIYDTLSGATSFYPVPIRRPGSLIPLPAVIWHVVSWQRQPDLAGNNQGLEHARVQFDMYSTALDTQRVVCDELLSLLAASAAITANAMDSPSDEYDDELGVYRRMMDVSIWNKTSDGSAYALEAEDGVAIETEDGVEIEAEY